MPATSLASLPPDAARAQPLSRVLADALEGLIVGGEMRPGERLNEQQLAQRFGVSRGPIREAIRALEGAGFVEAVPNKGVFVRRLTVAEVRELYDVRAALFALAGRLVAERADEMLLRRLQNLVTAMDAATAARDFDAYYPLTRRSSTARATPRSRRSIAPSSSGSTSFAPAAWCRAAASPSRTASIARWSRPSRRGTRAGRTRRIGGMWPPPRTGC
jgi:DNA-binding transcriptional regulator YhcF (GntR family)